MHERLPLVLLHGFTGCADVWEDVKSALAESQLCIAIDLPGHGHRAEDADSGAFTFDGACQLIATELHRIGIQRTNLWGYSMGGRIALHYAMNYPAGVGRLILESASPGLTNSVEREARQRSDDELAARIKSEGLDSFVGRWMDQPLFASQKSLPLEHQALGRRLRLQNTADGLARALRGFSVGRQEPLHNRLRQLTMPVLVLVGELDSKYREIGEAMAHSIPNAQFRIIGGAGHAPYWECPAETAAAVAEFISRDK